MEDLIQLEQRLKQAILKRRLVLFAAGIFALLATALVIALSLSVLAAVFIIPAPVKIGLLTVSLILVFIALYRYVYLPVRNEGGIVDAALRLEQRHPELKNRLVAALQFRHFNHARTNFSPALINLTGRQALELTSGMNFNEIVSGYPIWQKLRFAAAATVIVVVAGFLLPGFFGNALDVYSQPTVTVAPPLGYRLNVFPGDAERVKYTDVKIGGYLVGDGFPEKAEIFYRFADGRWQSEKLNLEKYKRFTVADPARPYDSLPFDIVLKQVRRSFDYYLVAGDLQSERHAVNIVERPRLTDVTVNIDYPAYTGLKPLKMEENNGSFAALVGSRAHLEFEANREIARAYLIKNDSGRLEIDFKGNRGSVDFKLSGDFSYHIRLVDKQGEENPDPIEYMVTAVPDEYPVINVLHPGFDLNLDERMMIPFSLQVSDDYGFTSLALKYEVVSGGRKGPESVAIINLPGNVKSEGEITFNWDLESFNLLPSDYVLYHFELADNDNVSGPKVSSTRVYVARLPSIDEIVAQTESEQEGRVFKAEKILQEQKELVRKMKDLAEQVRTSDEVDWQQKKDLENLVDKQQTNAEKIEQMAREMEKSLEELDKNNLLNEQILEKLKELQKLFNEVATEEMKEAMRKLAEDLKNMSREEIEEAMKQMEMSQEEMLARLERTVELLRRMQIEQKMAAMLKMAEEMLLEQNRVNVETEEKHNGEDNQRLAQRENQLQRQMDALRKEADKLRELLEDSPFSESEEHQQFAQAVEQNDAAPEMNEMEQQLNQNQMEQALQQGNQSSTKLSNMVQMMQQMMMQMAEKEGERLERAIRDAINDANYLTSDQEEIYGKCEGDNFRRYNLQKLAAEQQILKESVSSLYDRIDQLSKESPFLAAEIRSLLMESQKQMGGSCDNLGRNRARASMDQQRDAIQNMNKAAVRLLDGLEDQKQCNKGGTCNKPRMSMQSMCNKQQQINQETKGQCQNPGQKPSNSQLNNLKRLAAEQGSVRKSMQEMAQEFGNRREVLGRLDALSDEMKKIEEMLDEGNVGGELLDRQLRIYSRMLDVEKSLNRRDYSRERRAMTAEDILRNSPGQLEDEGMQRGETLQERLNRNLQNGYPRQYEQQIKAYFKALTGYTNGNSDTDDK